MRHRQVRHGKNWTSLLYLCSACKCHGISRMNCPVHSWCVAMHPQQTHLTTAASNIACTTCNKVETWSWWQLPAAMSARKRHFPHKISLMTGRVTAHFVAMNPKRRNWLRWLQIKAINVTVWCAGLFRHFSHSSHFPLSPSDYFFIKNSYFSKHLLVL